VPARLLCSAGVLLETRF